MCSVSPVSAAPGSGPSCSCFCINAWCRATAPFGSAGDGVALVLLVSGTAMGTAKVSRSQSRVSRCVGCCVPVGWREVSKAGPLCEGT